VTCENPLRLTESAQRQIANEKGLPGRPDSPF
jgi:hypothetical protein